MSSKLENYYNYIVNYMLSKTRYEIYAGAVVIYFPWGFYELYRKKMADYLAGVDSITQKTIENYIITHISSNYGVSDDECVEVLKRLLKKVYQNILKDLKNV